MGSKKTNSDTEYTRTYDRLHGIGASRSEKDGRARFEFIENMYVDYQSGDNAVESIPGFRKLLSDPGRRINGIFRQNLPSPNEYLIVHSGSSVLRFNKNNINTKPSLEYLTEIEDRKSSAFCFGNETYLTDGKNILRIDENGETAFVTDEDCKPYVPTLYKNGEKAEERNLLTESAREIFHSSSFEKYIYGNPELKYAVIDEKNRLCRLLGATSSIEGALYVPSYVKIGDDYYQVTEIANNAFKYHQSITEVYTYPGLKIIGKAAFWGCKSITKAVISYTVSKILVDSFFACSSLSDLTMNTIPGFVGTDSFLGCTSLITVKCASDISKFSELTKNSGLDTKNVIACEQNTATVLSLPLTASIRSVDEVMIESKTPTWQFDTLSNTLYLSFANEREYRGKEITVNVTLRGYENAYDRDSFLTNERGYAIGGIASILGCTVCENFDGRVFLSGNPSIPGVVFYSEKDTGSTHQPLYFSSKNYFYVGAQNYGITDMLSTNGRLTVFKEGDDGHGTVFLYEPKTTDGKPCYSLVGSFGSIPVHGGAVNFSDRSVFITDLGICSAEKASSGAYKEILCNSENISGFLRNEDLSGASVTKWLGYLVVGIGEHLYLADSRDTYTKNGALQYEWYRLSGIGTYNSDSRVYRYSDTPRDGYSLSDTPDKRVGETVFSTVEDGSTVWYTEENGKKLLVYPTEEFEGGEFAPASVIYSDGELLFFGTESGDICVFNTDMRGVAPSYIKASADFSPSEYKALMGRRIHPYFYSFNNHKAIYRLATAFDDCGIPELKKSTVRNSPVIKFKTFEASRVSVEAETDTGERQMLGNLPLSAFSFEGVNFALTTAAVSDFVNVGLPEYMRNWNEKRYLIYSDSFGAPFGVYSLSYRYKVRGKIK